MSQIFIALVALAIVYLVMKIYRVYKESVELRKYSVKYKKKEKSLLGVDDVKIKHYISESTGGTKEGIFVYNSNCVLLPKRKEPSAAAVSFDFFNSPNYAGDSLFPPIIYDEPPTYHHQQTEFGGGSFGGGGSNGSWNDDTPSDSSHSSYEAPSYNDNSSSYDSSFSSND